MVKCLFMLTTRMNCIKMNNFKCKSRNDEGCFRRIQRFDNKNILDSEVCH